MKRIAFLIACAALSLTGFCAAKNSDDPARKPEELRARGGLPNFFKKAKEGKDITIVYFGGSITEQRGWRLQSEAWLKNRYPNARIKAVDAAIGGTGSMFGAYRTERDVLSKKPDLVFVEFAVNDSAMPKKSVRETMEGIVRKILRADPETDICFVYTLTDNPRCFKPLENGKMFASSDAMEDVADHYSIPSVNFAPRIVALEKAGKLIMKAPGGAMTAVSGKSLDDDSAIFKDEQGRILFSRDGVHPYPNSGHIIYTRALADSLAKMENVGTAGRKALPPALEKNNYENANRFPVSDPRIRFYGRFRQIPPINLSKKISMLFSLEETSQMEFKARAKAISLLCVMGKHGAKADVFINGKLVKTIRTFDSYCTYSRVQIFPIFSSDTEQLCDVKVRVSSERFDKRKILFDSNKPDFDQNPAPSRFYLFQPAAVLAVGELLKR